MAASLRGVDMRIMSFGPAHVILEPLGHKCLSTIALTRYETDGRIINVALLEVLDQILVIGTTVC